MFMEIPKKTSVDLSTTTGAGSVRRVSGNGASAAEGKNSQISGQAAKVAGTGRDESAAGQALLMIQGDNNIRLTNGFFKEQSQQKESVKGEATIETHAAALFADGPEANGKFQKLMELASRGAKPASGKASPPEIELARQAIIPLEGADAQLGAVLRYAFSFSDTLPTAEDSIRLFKESNH
jgi:hypothetical protein